MTCYGIATQLANRFQCIALAWRCRDRLQFLHVHLFVCDFAFVSTKSKWDKTWGNNFVRFNVWNAPSKLLREDLPARTGGWRSARGIFLFFRMQIVLSYFYGFLVLRNENCFSLASRFGGTVCLNSEIGGFLPFPWWLFWKRIYDVQGPLHSRVTTVSQFVSQSTCQVAPRPGMMLHRMWVAPSVHQGLTQDDNGWQTYFVWNDEQRCSRWLIRRCCFIFFTFTFQFEKMCANVV